MVLRKLQDGWDYRPNWRVQVVDELLNKWRQSTSLSQIIWDEPDPYVRQDLLFRAGARCVDPDAFAFAHNCDENPRSAATVIKSMAVAKCSSQKIADYVATSRRNVTAYLKLFFDIGRYVENRAWLHTIVFQPELPSLSTPRLLRERMLMVAAFSGGWRQLERMLTGTPPSTSAEVQEMTEAIKAAVAFRAFQFVSGMGAVPATPEDFCRYVDLMRVPAQADLREQNTKMDKFRDSLLGVLQTKAQLQPENPRFADFRAGGKYAPAPELVALPVPAGGS